MALSYITILYCDYLLICLPLLSTRQNPPGSSALMFSLVPGTYTVGKYL